VEGAVRNITSQPTDPGFDPLQAVAAQLASRPYARRGVSIRETPVRVLLVDDHAVLRAGIRALLAATPDIDVVGEAANGTEAVTLATALQPDLVVMDLDMPAGGGAEATRALMELVPPPRVLILSMHTEEEQLVPLLECGANGYLAKDAAERELVEAIRVVASGDTYVRPHVARLLAASFRRKGQPDEQRKRYESLSVREQTVVRLTAEGYNGPEVGHQLGISPKTVDTYKQRIEEKLGITHRTEYVRFAISLDLLAK
jgi:two-component system, NarL family, response regulator NreC